MLIDILRMPPVLGIPIDRRVAIYSGYAPPPISAPVRHIHWPTAPLYNVRVDAGSMIDVQPDNVFKAIHISDDGQWVFETVFAMEWGLTCVCLYTKMISPVDIGIAVSLGGIVNYQHEQPPLLPISNFIHRNLCSRTLSQGTALTTSMNVANSIVPVIFGEKHLGEYLSWISETEYSPESFGIRWQPIYQQEPAIFDALMEGKFRRTPFQEVPLQHPMIEIPKNKFYNYQELSFAILAKGFDRHVNHEAFDEVVLRIIQLLPTKITIRSLMAHALDQITDLWLIEECTDAYQGALRGMSFDEQNLKSCLSMIFHQCAMIYCRLYSIDFGVYLQNMNEKSSITISKNIYDEVAVTFQDRYHDRNVSFYASFPSLALTTLSVGWYDPS